jgi:hypothetical protein
MNERTAAEVGGRTGSPRNGEATAQPKGNNVAVKVPGSQQSCMVARRGCQREKLVSVATRIILFPLDEGFMQAILPSRVRMKVIIGGLTCSSANNATSKSRSDTMPVCLAMLR